MDMKKKVLSAILAAVVGVSSSAVSTGALGAVSAFAAETTPEYTFDGINIREPIDADLFNTLNDEEVQKELEKALFRAVGKSNGKYESVTYKDLMNIKTLNLSKLELTELPKCIEYMTGLQTLNLSDNLLQSSALAASKLDLSHCTELKSVNLSNNYLTSVPRWAITEKVTTRNLSGNFIKSEDPRKIRIEEPLLTHYYVEGDDIFVDDLVERVLKSVTFDEKVSGKYVKLPDFLEYNPNDLVNNKLKMDTSELEACINKSGVVELPGDKSSRILTLKVTLCDCSEAEVRVYLLNGSDITTLNVQLSTLLTEYDTIKGKKSDYTETSWTKYENAYTMAKAISDYTKQYEDLSMLRNAFNLFNSARKALTENVSSNKTISDTLKALETVGKTYKEADYTPSSWAAFKSAYDTISALSKNGKNVSETEAHTAIRRFLSAQSGLTGTSLRVPATAPKADFEQIYGEDMSQTYEGIMLDGKKYTWTFRGKDITVPVDFKPEVQNTHALSSDIMMETGSANGYRLFSTVQTGAFPGTATLDIELTDFADGNYYLYKWDTSSKRGKMQKSVTVADSKLSTTLNEGGLYYISSVVRNFDLKSTQFPIDTAGKRIIIPLLGTSSVSRLKSSMEFGGYVEVTDENGDSVSNVSLLYEGMTVKAPGGDPYTVKTSGDINNDGKYTLDDITRLVDIYANNTPSDVSDINGDGVTNLADITDFLHYYTNLI